MSKVNNMKSRWENLGKSQKNPEKQPSYPQKQPTESTKLNTNTDTPTGQQIQAGQMQELDSILKSLEGFTLDDNDTKEDGPKERKEDALPNESTSQNVYLKVELPTDEKTNDDQDGGVTMRKDNNEFYDSKIRDSLLEEKERIKEARDKLKKSSRDLTLDLETLAVMEGDMIKVGKSNEENKEHCESVAVMRKETTMEEERKAVKSAEYTAKDSHKEEKDMLKDVKEKLKKTSREFETEKGEADVIFRKKEGLNPADSEHRKSARLSLRNSLAPVLEDHAKEDENEVEDNVEKSEVKIEKPEVKIEKPEVKVEKPEEEEVEKRKPEFKEMLDHLQRSTSFESFKDLTIKTFMSLTDELAKVKKEMRELKSSSAPSGPAPPPMAAPPPPPPPPPPGLTSPPKLVIAPAKRKTVSSGSDVPDGKKPAAVDLMAEIRKKQNARQNRASLKVKLAKLN